MRTLKRRPEHRLRLSAVSWRDYLCWLRVAEGRHLRLTYDRGELEVMTLPRVHEWFAHFLGDMVVVLSEELDMPRLSAGSTTLKRKLLRRGLEADDSYYLANEPVVRHRDQINLKIDPPPDLGIEVDVTRSSIKRLPIYRALKVPEVWRYDTRRLLAYLLNERGEYDKSHESRCFPGLKLADVERFLAKRGGVDETTLLRSFRDWVRGEIAAGRLRKP